MYLGNLDLSKLDYAKLKQCPVCAMIYDADKIKCNCGEKLIKCASAFPEARKQAKEYSKLTGLYVTLWRSLNSSTGKSKFAFTLRAYQKLEDDWICSVVSRYFPAHIAGYWLKGKLKMLTTAQIERAGKREEQRAFSADR